MSAALIAEDRREARATHLRQTEEALRDQLEIALSNAKGFVAYVAHIGGRDVVKGEPVAETVSDTLAYDDTLACLMNVLANSQCALVAALRENIVRRVVEARATDIAEATA